MPQDPKWFFDPDEMRQRAAQQKAERETAEKAKQSDVCPECNGDKVVGPVDDIHVCETCKGTGVRPKEGK